MGGYQEFLNVFANELGFLSGGTGPVTRALLHLNTVVRQIQWRDSAVKIGTQTSRGSQTFEAPRVLVTLPLGVLQARTEVRFDPELPSNKLSALNPLVMGKVLRVTLCFREAPWARVGRALLPAESSGEDLSNLSFLFSHDEYFPTWWTQMPEHLPMITGWSPAHCAERMAGMTDGRIIDKAVESLANLLHLQKAHLNSQLNSAYLHNWNIDPFSRGAYSYVKAGGEGCQATLAQPLANTLFLAGEHTDTTGHNGTVHGAIGSGQRAAKEILQGRA